MNPPAILAPELKTSVALVRRVCDRMAAGVPLSLALAGEPVSFAEYDELLRRHPELAAEQGFARRRFFQNAVGTLLDAKDASANVRWLLERLYPDVLAQPRDGVTVNVTASTSTSTSAVAEISGMSQEYLRALEEGGRRL